MFSIEMLPAAEGDALWIEYGDPAAPHRILVDCGYKSTYREIMERLRTDPQITFELFLLTHIDNDHIAGAVPFVADRDVTPDRLRKVWFNGRRQIDVEDILGVREAEFFTKTLERRRFAWNEDFAGGRVAVPAAGPGEPILLPGGMSLTVLSPGHEQLVKLAEEWDKKLEDVLQGRELEEILGEAPARLQPDVLGEPNVKQLAKTEFIPDDEPPNGSSIAVLAEYQDSYDGNREKSILLTGDCFSPVLEASLSKLLLKRGAERLRLDALKLSHHGSKGNTSSHLLDLIRCRHFLFSTNGNRHKHPDPECVARVIASQAQPIDLHFNYLSDFNRMWRSLGLQRQHLYTPHYPREGEAGLKMEL
jgi:glyoxylase-like metal-dependent hydrolase (beta-lactamase superfamily II)